MQGFALKKQRFCLLERQAAKRERVHEKKSKNVDELMSWTTHHHRSLGTLEGNVCVSLVDRQSFGVERENLTRED